MAHQSSVPRSASPGVSSVDGSEPTSRGVANGEAATVRGAAPQSGRASIADEGAAARPAVLLILLEC